VQEFFDNAAVKKLQCKTLLDLALVLPASYEDRRLATHFENGKTQTFAVKVLQSINQNQNLKITFFLPALNQKIFSTIFHPKPFHYKIFSVGKEMYVSAKVGLFNGFFQLTQPKVVTSVGKIEPIYKEPKIRQDSIKAVIKKYITPQNLKDARLYEDEIETLMGLHFPNSVPDFEDARTLAVLKTVEIFNHMQKLRGKRSNYPALKRLNGDLQPFLQKLPFRLTDEQNAAIAQIQKDLNSDVAAKRMVVGDVGSGKTMAILAAAQIAYPHKTILMAPTSILANQLYEEARKYLQFDVALLTSAKTLGDYEKANFVVATHAILYKENLQTPFLVMVDEQHRFGVKQRHKLTKLTQTGQKKPHFLQFSATPIPRTQAMIDAQMVDISLITSTPFKKDITSKIIKANDFADLTKHIKSEIAANRQVLIIYPLVNESENFNYQSLEEGQHFWKKNFTNVYVTHGKDKNKDSVLESFKEKGDILLATTVVEVGISLPRLSTIVIVGAENLGLATLHQLRGRVSRNGLKGYCFLFTKSNKTQRLEQFCKTTNGFEIARLDLKFRKSGDLIDGKMQSGNQFRWIDLSEDEDIIRKVQQRIT
jgi:ATP-dependent DNA helicase RecG